MDPAVIPISDGDRRLLTAHYWFYHALDAGGRMPTTTAQEHFVAVCRGTASPVTDHERAYSRFKTAIAAVGAIESAVVAAGFTLPVPESSDDFAEAQEFVEIPVRPCAGCGRPIPPERLEDVPNASRCVPCQHRSDTEPSDWRVSEVECPRCAAQGRKARMVWRTARDPAAFSGYFLGCSRFTECRYIDRS